MHSCIMDYFKAPFHYFNDIVVVSNTDYQE